ncbi:hypothetical protein MDMS009_53 [Methylophaga thiooxydans DMS010]|uniref:DUF2726 domain-containing protein n=2 Tax=Methylophaga thiooxydans TaxID=392484 RepID=C0N1S8_9GAMM|nr:hypothetical protein MDMS009_53 [Methylophaga thiooxydans DMS010]
MQLIAVIAILFLISAWMLIRFSRKKTTASMKIQKRTVLLDSSQREFKKRLVDAVKGDFEVLPRVHLADLVSLKFKADDKASRLLQQKIAASSVDFVLLDALNGRIACVVQFDKEQDTEQANLLTTTCQQANLALLHFSKETALDSAQLKKKVLSALEPTIQFDDDSETDAVKVYLEPVANKAEHERKIVLENS